MEENILPGISLINIEKRIGSRTLPCGIPEVTLLHLENLQTLISTRKKTLQPFKQFSSDTTIIYVS